MNEQALKDSYELFKQKGYTKSFDEYVNLINTNPNALNDSYSLFKEQGYGKSIEEFSTLVVVKKKRRVRFYCSRGRYGIHYTGSSGRSYLIGCFVSKR